jgi:hypothetical protein
VDTILHRLPTQPRAMNEKRSLWHDSCGCIGKVMHSDRSPILRIRYSYTMPYRTDCDTFESQWPLLLFRGLDARRLSN